MELEAQDFGVQVPFYRFESETTALYIISNFTSIAPSSTPLYLFGWFKTSGPEYAVYTMCYSLNSEMTNDVTTCSYQVSSNSGSRWTEKVAVFAPAKVARYPMSLGQFKVVNRNA